MEFGDFLHRGLFDYMHVEQSMHLALTARKPLQASLHQDKRIRREQWRLE
jgi:hypothetical protein